jgi:hypothetical protein
MLRLGFAACCRRICALLAAVVMIVPQEMVTDSSLIAPSFFMISRRFSRISILKFILVFSVHMLRGRPLFREVKLGNSYHVRDILFVLLFGAFKLFLRAGELVLEFTVAYDVPYCITDAKERRANDNEQGSHGFQCFRIK